VNPKTVEDLQTKLAALEKLVSNIGKQEPSNQMKQLQSDYQAVKEDTKPP
jgi:hypothetical protein